MDNPNNLYFMNLSLKSNDIERPIYRQEIVINQETKQVLEVEIIGNIKLVTPN